MNRSNYKSWLLQLALIFISLSVILSAAKFTADITVAALGATSFILFVYPNTRAAEAKRVIGGYFCGAASGMVFNFLHYVLFGLGYESNYPAVILCAASATLAVFLMAMADLGHPPGAALALILPYGDRCLINVAAALFGVMILCSVKEIFAMRLINLIEEKQDNAAEKEQTTE